MNTPIPPYSLRIAQAVGYSGIDRTSLYEEMKAGNLTYLKRGKVRLIRVADLQRWLDSHEVSGQESR